MASMKCIYLLAIIGVAVASPALRQSNKNDLSVSNMVDEMRSNCDNGLDSMACFKVKVMSFLETVFKQDNFKITEDVEVHNNGFKNENNGRSSSSGDSNILESLEDYIQGHDLTFKLPLTDAKVTVSPRNIDDDELSVNIKLPSDKAQVDGRRRKNRLRKIAMPIMVLVLLKAMTLIPMAIGILGLKAFNALQLGFFSFMVSVGLAIFQLCKKLATDHHPAHISAHGPWETRSYSAVESLPEFKDAQKMAYKAYA